MIVWLISENNCNDECNDECLMMFNKETDSRCLLVYPTEQQAKKEIEYRNIKAKPIKAMLILED